MPYDAVPQTTVDRADFDGRDPPLYPVRVQSLSEGADITVHRDRGGVLVELAPAQRRVEVVGGVVRVTLLDLAPWAANDVLVVARSTAAQDTAAHTGAAATSFTRLFALVRELLNADLGVAPAVNEVQLKRVVDAALAVQDPKWTAALQARLQATMSANEVRSAIDAALDDLPTDIRQAVDGAFVVGLVDTETGGSEWRTPQEVSVNADPAQFTGDGSRTNTLTLITDAITVGLIAANAVTTRNLLDGAVTLDKLSSALQARWRELGGTIEEITSTGGTATYRKVDGTTGTFDVGQGSGGGGGGAGAALMVVRLPAAPAKTLAGTANAWSAWTELVHSRGLTAEEAGVIGMKGAVVGNVTSDATTGGQRVWVQSRIMRKRGAVETDLGHSIPYVRNLGSGVTQDTEDVSQLLEAPVSVDDGDGQAGDEYHLDVRVFCQGVAQTLAFKESTAAAPAGTSLSVKTYGAGGASGGLSAVEVFSEGGQREPVKRGDATELFFRDANVTFADGRASVDPIFPPQQPADWNATSGPTRIVNKPGAFVDTYTERPVELAADRLYAWAGAPDRYGGPGLYRSVVNQDTPLNLVAGRFLPQAGAGTGLMALPVSPSNHWLEGFGVNLSNAANPLWLWVDEDAPAAATLYAQFRAPDASGTWSPWSAVVTFSERTGSPTAGLVAPSGSRQYRALSAAFPANWAGGYGRDVQVRLWTDRLATTPYDLKLAHTVQWIEDPEVAKAYLESRSGKERLSTHSLRDGAVARVFEADPADLSGYVEGELVVILSSPPVMKFVQATRDQPVPNANRFTVSTDGQGNGVAAQGDFDPNPGTNFLQIHVAPGDGTATHPGRVVLYVDTPGDTPPDGFIGIGVTPGFPRLDFTRIVGSETSAVVGAREYQGYEATFTSTSVGGNLLVFSDATFSYDLFTAYTSASVNTPLNVNTGTVHIPASLQTLSGGTGGVATVPSGGWDTGQLSAAARSARNVSVDTRTFTGDSALSSGDDNVQAALETLGGAGGRPIRIGSADAPDADGQVPLWLQSGTKWVAGKLAGMQDALIARFAGETVTFGLAGKLLEIYNAFSGGSWTNAAGGIATNPAVASAPLAVRPVGVLGSWVFTIYAANVSPAWPQTEGGQTWIVVRMPSGLAFREERYRLVVVDSGGAVQQAVNLDAAAVTLIGTSGGWHYYRLQVDRIGAGEGYRVQGLVPFAPVRSRLDLVTSMLRDFVAAATRTQANDRRVVVWDWATRGFVLGNPERPTPIAVLPDPMEVGRRYITTGRSRLQPTISVTPAAAGANILATATFKVGTEDWQLIRFGPGAGAPYASQTVLRAPAGSTLGLAAGGTPPFLAIRYGGGEANLGNVGTDARSMILAAPPAYVAGTTYELVLRRNVDPHENVPPAQDVDAGDWTATGTHDVVGTPGAAFDWATRGNPDPIPAGKIPHLAGQEVLRHAFRMPLTTTLSNNRFSAPALLDASVDLDDAELAGAEIIVTLDVEIEGTGSNDTLSWESDAAAPTAQDRRYHFSTRVGVAALERQADYVARTGGAPDGFLEVLELSAFRAGTTQGRLFVGVVHEEDRNAAGTGAGDLDRPGVFVYWTGAAGAVGAVVSGTVTAHLSRITGGSASSFTGLPDTPASYTGEAGKIPKVNAAANALEFALDSDSFLRMRDTPDAYTGQEAKGVVVGATGLEFRDMPLNASGKAGGKGSLMFSAAIPAGVHTAGTELAAAWTIPAAFAAIATRQGNSLRAPSPDNLPVTQCGYIIEVTVAGTLASRNWVPLGALSSLVEIPTSTIRADSRPNFAIGYKLGCTVFGGTAGNRSVNLQYQRQLTERHRDAFTFYGAGNAAILAQTVVSFYEWNAGEGTAVTESSQADFDAQTSYDDDTLYVVTS